MHRTRYHFLEETTSTNDEARNPRYGHGDAICAERQTAGRGQRGHTWSSEEGRNLMFSLVWEPRFLPVSEQFLLSEAVALALTDLFGGYGIDARIKWTNDIYAGDRKLVGILIEHSYTGPTLGRSVAGIGINVNQETFPDEIKETATSLKVETGKPVKRAGVIAAVMERFEQYYEQFVQREDLSGIREAYEACLVNRDRDVRVLDPAGAYEAHAKGINDTGELIVVLPDGTEREIYAGEVSVRGIYGYV